MFKVNQKYTKTDIYRELDVPPNKQKGSWDTGYTRYNGNIYIFANVGVAGRTGVDHGNHWDGHDLIWHAKQSAKIDQPLMKEMRSSKNVLVFTREDSRDPFNFEGKGIAKEFFDESPIRVRWSFEDLGLSAVSIDQPVIAEEVKETNIYEGATTSIRINRYERSDEARKKCIEHWGCFCQVCGFDFSKKYKSVNDTFIHVHHIIPLYTIGKEYRVDPIKDLIPVCPNCHAMIHSKREAYTIEEIKKLLR